MGDAKVKQPFFGTQSHHHHHHHHHHLHHAAHETSSTTTPPTTSKNNTTMASTAIDQKHATSGLLGNGTPQQHSGVTAKDAAAGNATNPASIGKDKSPSTLKYEQLKQRKQELEKRLNEKYSQLQQVKREEAQLIGMYPSDFSCGIGPSGTEGNNGSSGSGNGVSSNGTAPTLRRKIGTSFKLPENLLNNKEDDINKLLLEKQIQQQISEASLRLANDNGQSKSVRRTHKQNYEMAQQKLLAINQNLSVLKKRQQQQQQAQLQAQQQSQLLSPTIDNKPIVRDDIDLHKTSQANRFRSNSNSSSMVMHLSERRNSVKSNASSNASGSVAGHHQQHYMQQQQMLQVQIPGHYHNAQQQQPQISPYSIHSGIVSSGSQSMTSAASAAMISQLNMLRHRTRTDSFSGIVSYDAASAGSAAELNVKISPISGNGSITSGGSINQQQQPLSHHMHHHHHQHAPITIGPGPNRMNRLIQQQIGVNYSPPPGAACYVLSPTTISSPANGIPNINGGQAFVYDSKAISRLQGSTNSIVHHSPPPPSSSTAVYGHAYGQNSPGDQNYCPNTMLAVTPTCVGDANSNNNSNAPGRYDHGHASVGLGGYWMTMDNGEKVWCSVDSRQFSSLDRKQGAGTGGSMKLSRTSTKLSGTKSSSGHFQPAAKSSSLGNFQEYIGKPTPQEEEMISVQPDAISVTSGSSEHKKREKIWRETSLDSPVVKHKALPPPPPVVARMSPPIGNGHLLHSPKSMQLTVSPQSPPLYHHRAPVNNPTVPLHINTNVSSYVGAGMGSSSPLLLSPQQMQYYQQRQQQLLEQQRQRIKQQQQHIQQQRLHMDGQHKQVHSHSARQSQHLIESSVSSLQPPLAITSMGATSTALTTTTLEHYNTYQYQQQQPTLQNPPPYHSRHQHPPAPPLPPQNHHHYHHSQQQHRHPPSVPAQSIPLPQHLDLLPQSYSQVTSVPHQSQSSNLRSVLANHPDGYYQAPQTTNMLSSRHPDLVISPTLSQASSHTLTSPTSIVQALPMRGSVGETEDHGSGVSPTPSMVTYQQSSGGGPTAGQFIKPSDIQMESPKNMTVVQQGKIMPYKEVTKPFEMSDFYKYSTKYRQKQQQQQQPSQQAEDCSFGNNDTDGGSSTTTGDAIHKGVYQPPNRSICQPINNYN